MLASDLYAITQGCTNSGPDQCHWCASSCQRQLVHDDVPPVPFQRTKTTAKRPNNCYICMGCWLWRRGSITIDFLSNQDHDRHFKDRQTPKKHSWLVTEQRATAIRMPADSIHLYSFLLRPTNKFFLCFRDGIEAPDTLLQLAILNDTMQVKADTSLYFTVNNITHQYSVYDLEQSLRTNNNVTGGPGVQALRRILGPYSLPSVKEDEPKKSRGRPSVEETQKIARLHAFTSAHAIVTPAS